MYTVPYMQAQEMDCGRGSYSFNQFNRILGAFNSGKNRKKSYSSSTKGQATGLSLGLDLTAHHPQALLILLEGL